MLECTVDQRHHSDVCTGGPCPRGSGQPRRGVHRRSTPGDGPLPSALRQLDRHSRNITHGGTTMTIPNETSTRSEDEMTTRSEQLSTADVAAAAELRRTDRTDTSFDADTNAAVDRKPADRT